MAGFSTQGVKPMRRGPLQEGTYTVSLDVEGVRIDAANSGTVFIETRWNIGEVEGRKIRQTWWMTENALPFVLGDILTCCSVDELPTIKGATRQVFAQNLLDFLVKNVKSAIKVRIAPVQQQSGQFFPEIVEFIG